MKVLVTGGAGFIGSHLVERLTKDGHGVVVLDNLSSGKEENLHFKTAFFQGDIRNIDDVKRAMRGCEAVFHLAALTDVRNTNSDENYQVNLVGSKNVFDIAKENKAKIIFTSSAAVYGDAKNAVREESRLRPISDYGKNKMKAEKLLPENSFIIRIFNVYGLRGKSVVNVFCNKMLKYEKISVFGDGLATRDYVYVRDVVNALILGLKQKGVYNVGTGEETSVLKIIDIIQSLTNNKPKIEFTLPIPGEIRKSRADIAKIKKLGWEPKTKIEEGIKLLLDIS